MNSSSNISNNVLVLQDYFNRVKRGIGLSAKDKVQIMNAFDNIHNKLFDKAVKFNQSEISKPPFSISYHQLNKILFLYFLNKNNINTNLETGQSAQNILTNFENLKYSPAILTYLTWLRNEFYPETIEDITKYLKKNAR